jgi:hypothetical protein
MSYVVYGHYDDAGVCFYVGIGNKKRPYGFSRRSDFWKNYVKKHCVSGKPEVKIWHQNLSWEQAQEHEIFWISVYGRRDLGTGCLVNLTDGGDGTVNPSKETRRKISEGNKGKVMSNEARQKISISSKGRVASDETRKKISNNSLKINLSSETLKKRSLAVKGKPLSEEHKAKLSAAKKGKTFSEETKQKLSQALKGRTPWNKGKKRKVANVQ